MKRTTTLTKIICPLNLKYGAPMGRDKVGNFESAKGKIYDKAVPMGKDAGYDKGGAYWGIGAQMRVRYTKDMQYIEFYRLGDKMPPLPEPFTLVRFYMEGGEVLAVFPEQNHNKRMYGNGVKVCYSHLGQHGNADKYYYEDLPESTPEQYADLKRELESAPYNYNLKVVKGK